MSQRRRTARPWSDSKTGVGVPGPPGPENRSEGFEQEESPIARLRPLPHAGVVFAAVLSAASLVAAVALVVWQVTS